MILVKPSYKILGDLDGVKILKQIEEAGRECYQSSHKITEDSYLAFARMIIKNGHEAMLEHGDPFRIKFICDRTVSHQLVRHRLASFAQESQRYCIAGDKGKEECLFILPHYYHEAHDYDNYEDPQHMRYQNPPTPEQLSLIRRYRIWLSSMSQTERSYFEQLAEGAKPEEARLVLVNSAKTTIVVTMNPRETRHVGKLRTDLHADPSIRHLMRPLFAELKEKVPVLFDDINW